ncbi:MAG: DUF5107 domain-containing protein [Acidobacteriaceae bacterium]|nr:DUF5107 domain-containing protein [Acidobacteriaceae bacterium]
MNNESVAPGIISGGVVCLLMLAALPVAGETRVWQGTLSLPTYGEGAPDPKPVFDVIYPYTMRNALAGPKARKAWRTVEIENEYLKCTVLPDLGGRVYGCLEKIGRHEMFYANAAIRKYGVGPRGLEIAAGEEFEFPVNPGLVTLSPVDSGWRRNADGSVSVFTGNTGREGMRWVVELILRPGCAVLEQHVRISNPDSVRHPYTWWERTAIPAFTDSKFYLPAHVTTDAQGADAREWDGRISRQAAERRFAYGSREGSFAVYSNSDGSGTAHWADAQTMPGKGFAYRGSEAVKNLSDDGSQFVDMESGLFGDPSAGGFLEPGASRDFTDFWMPLRGLGGFSRGNADAAVHVERTPAGLKVSLNVFRNFPNARVVVTEAGEVVMDEHISLNPGFTLARVARSGGGGKHHFELLDEQNRTVLEYTEGFVDAAQEKGKSLFEVTGLEDKALVAGRQALIAARYEDAIKILPKAIPTPEAHHYLGLAYANAGQDEKARAVFGIAPHDRMFGVPSQIEMAKLFGRAGDRKGALKALQEALQIRADVAGSGALEVALLRANGMKQQASERLAALSALDPSDPVLRFEAVQLGAPGDELWKFLAGDPARVTQLAEFYLRAGLWEDASELLSRRYPEVDALQREPGTVLPQDDPLVSYERGYAQQRANGQGREEFAVAEKQPLRFVFPNRPEALWALKAALEANSRDGLAHYLLGVFYSGAGAADKGTRELTEALKHQAPVAGIKTQLAHVESEPVKARPDPIKEALAPAPSTIGETADERAQAALDQLAHGRFKEAKAVFTEGNFPSERQSEAVRIAFLEVRLQNVLEMSRRRRCDEIPAAVESIGEEDSKLPFTMYGFGSIVKTARVQFLLAEAQSECGEQKEAKKRFARAVKAGEHASGMEWAYGQLAAGRLGGSIDVDQSKLGKDAEGLYALGLLQRATGKKAEAQQSFQAASTAANGGAFLRYLCAMALAGR